jgi:hypothetical protein
MDKFLLSTKKRVLLPIVFAAAFLLWLVLCHENYKSYWLGTIYRVQTADFNMLHATLPPTLSQLIVAGRDDVIQKVLDSNYGLFGLIVTDPTDQSIIYRTGKIYHRESWQGRIAPENLAAMTKAEPYDVLSDPPPLGPAWEHPTPRSGQAEKVKSASASSSAKVLGHLYYVRPAPPPFLEDLFGFLSTGIFEMSGAKRGYLYITLITLAFSTVALLLVWLRQRGLEMKQSQLEFVHRELEIRKKALEHLAAELGDQKARKAWLEKEADCSYERVLSLKRSLERLKSALTLVGVPPKEGTKDPSPQGLPNNLSAQGPSALFEEIEKLVPALTDNAVTLKSQASLLNDYCSILEQRQAQMKRIVDQAYVRANRAGQVQPIDNNTSKDNIIDMTP